MTRKGHFLIMNYKTGFLGLLIGALLLQSSWAVKLAGFKTEPYYGEQVKTLTLDSGVRVMIDAPADKDFNPRHPTRLIYFSLPNGNTLEQTWGKKLREGTDWHYDIQHIGAQTRLLRKRAPQINWVVAIMEAPGKSWPAWGKTHSEEPTAIPIMIKEIAKPFAKYSPAKILSSHSGGGSLWLRYLQNTPKLPKDIQQIIFLDSIYNYSREAQHPQILTRWLNQNKTNTLAVISYDDRNVLFNGKPIVSATGGTWRRTAELAEDMGKTFSLTSTDSESYLHYQEPKGQIDLIFLKNPNLKILHTTLVGEMSGYGYTLSLNLPKSNTPVSFQETPIPWKEFIQPEEYQFMDYL
jgi:hypothetical protein